MFSQLFYDLLASGEWWDTVLTDPDLWEARQFTIRPSTAPGKKEKSEKSTLLPIAVLFCKSRDGQRPAASAVAYEPRRSPFTRVR